MSSVQTSRAIHTSTAIALLLAVSAPAAEAARATPEQLCAGRKAKAAGAFANCLAAAEKKLALSGEVNAYDDKVNRCQTNYSRAWQAIEARAGTGVCPTEGDETAIGSFMDACTQSVAVAVSGGPLPPDVLTCTADLATCDSDLITCDGSLMTCNAGLATCTSDLATAQDGLDTCSGSLATCNAGTAAAGQVLAGETFSSSAGLDVAGTMTNVGRQNVTPGTAAVTILEGYHDGTGVVAADADLVAANIREGVDIFGVEGTLSSTAAECPCFGLGMARLAIRALQPGIDPTLPSSEYCISQPGIVGQVDAGFSDAVFGTNFGVTSASVISNLQTGALQCYIFVRHGDYLQNITFGGVTPAERDACRAVMQEAIALEDGNDRCNKRYP